MPLVWLGINQICFVLHGCLLVGIDQMHRRLESRPSDWTCPMPWTISLARGVLWLPRSKALSGGAVEERGTRSLGAAHHHPSAFAISRIHHSEPLPMKSLVPEGALTRMGNRGDQWAIDVEDGQHHLLEHVVVDGPTMDQLGVGVLPKPPHLLGSATRDRDHVTVATLVTIRRNSLQLMIGENPPRD